MFGICLIRFSSCIIKYSCGRIICLFRALFIDDETQSQFGNKTLNPEILRKYNGRFSYCSYAYKATECTNIGQWLWNLISWSLKILETYINRSNSSDSSSASLTRTQLYMSVWYYRFYIKLHLKNQCLPPKYVWMSLLEVIEQDHLIKKMVAMSEFTVEWSPFTFQPKQTFAEIVIAKSMGN